MMTTKACVRGCSIRNQHRAECEGDCNGCLPRRAEHGDLCWPCHFRLRDMLTKATALDGWLGGNMTMGEGAAKVRQDYERRGGEDGAPTPLKIEIYDVRQQLRDHWSSWVDWLVEREGLHGPDHHDVERDAGYLLSWLDRVEAWDTIGDLLEHTAYLMSCAHALAPWRPEVKRVPRLECPECGEVNMVIYGGDSHVTCHSCRAVIPAEHLGIWERIVEQEAS